MKIEVDEHYILTIITEEGRFHFQCSKEDLEKLGRQLFNEYGCIDWT